MKRIGIVGSRRRDTNKDFTLLIEKLTEIYKDGDQIVSGGCAKGADRFAELIAKSRGITIIIHYPNIKKYGTPQCFFMRNTDIAKDSEVLIALPADDRKGGTEDTITKAERLGKEVILI